MDQNNLNSIDNNTILNSNLTSISNNKDFINIPGILLTEYNQKITNNNHYIKINQLYLALINVVGLIILKKALYK